MRLSTRADADLRRTGRPIGWPDPPASPLTEAAAARRAALLAAAKKRERRMFARWATGAWIATSAWFVAITPEIGVLDWRTGLHAIVGMALSFLVLGDLGWAALTRAAEYGAKHVEDRKRLATQLKWMRGMAYVGVALIVYTIAKAALFLMHARLPAAH